MQEVFAPVRDYHTLLSHFKRAFKKQGVARDTLHGTGAAKSSSIACRLET